MGHEECNKKERKFDVYANGINITFGPFDFTISFTKNTGSGNEDLGEVTMSPEHLKVISSILKENIDNYEDLFGTIPNVHPNVISQLRKDGKLQLKQDKNE